MECVIRRCILYSHHDQRR